MSDEEFESASLVEKVNYLEGKLDQVFLSASNGKNLASARDAAPSVWGNAQFNTYDHSYYEQPTAYSYSGYVYNAERLSHSYVFIPSVSVNRVVGMIKQVY